ncbi:MAG TPA: methyltransferase domain-containing protein [Ktedonobacteraceae bacterium]|jgi:ubiquinone/menaquinone biosynthesis C-methylase UbiE
MSRQRNEQQAQARVWNSPEVVKNWEQASGSRQTAMEEATEEMLLAAGLKSGDHVLDLAAGIGDQSLLAARKVGIGGMVLATDLSPEMLNVATKRAQQEGFTTIMTRVMDAEQINLEERSFDAVICRNGLMLLPHLQSALRGVRRVLKPGGKLAALVWSRNPFHLLPLTVLAKYRGKVSAKSDCSKTGGLPNPFTLSDPAVFEQALREAGFREVMIRPIALRLQFASMDTFFESRRGMIAELTGQMSKQAQQQILNEVRQALSQFEGPEGLVAQGETLLGVGTNPE